MKRSIVKRENDVEKILDQVCKPLDKTNYQKVIKDLKDTFLDQVNQCVGLAAPQIGIPYKAFAIIDIEKSKEKKTPLIMINPTILQYSTENVVSIEGCMSMEKGKEWILMRAKTIKVSYYDEQFKIRVKQFSGLQSRVIQHEYDHLYGKCIDKIGRPVEMESKDAN